MRGHFLKGLTTRENSRLLQGIGPLTRTVSYVLGARNANMIARKIEEMRLSIWIEQEMTRRLGSKRRAKEDLLARYASHVYMGNGQYGFATAAQYYFGRPLATFTAADADKAAVLAGIPKSPRDNAPSAKDSARIVRRRNQTLALMAAEDFISRDQEIAARQQSLPIEAHSPADRPIVCRRRPCARRARSRAIPTLVSRISCWDGSRCTRRLTPAYNGSRTTRCSTASNDMSSATRAPAG